MKQDYNYDQKKIDDLEKTIIVAYDCLLSDDIETAIIILKEQIEKTYD
jgi:hypothetical protein